MHRKNHYDQAHLTPPQRFERPKLQAVMATGLLRLLAATLVLMAVAGGSAQVTQFISSSSASSASTNGVKQPPRHLAPNDTVGISPSSPHTVSNQPPHTPASLPTSPTPTPTTVRQEVSSHDSHPGVAPTTGQLAPELVRRFQRAQTEAQKEGITLVVTSGWRSLARQRSLYNKEIALYDSPAEAKKWVLPAQKSEHPQGRAIDIGPKEAGVWLAENGWRYGLCQRYANEWWHFEPLVAPGGSCPALARDATDPRILRD